MGRGKDSLVSVVVDKSRSAVFQATYDCVVHCWVGEKRVNNEINDMVAITLHPPKDNPVWRGISIPYPDTLLPVHMDRGDILYAYSEGEAEFNFSVVPR